MFPYIISLFTLRVVLLFSVMGFVVFPIAEKGRMANVKSLKEAILKEIYVIIYFHPWGCRRRGLIE